jgi:iron(III) transport system permease protein
MQRSPAPSSETDEALREASVAVTPAPPEPPRAPAARALARLDGFALASLLVAALFTVPVITVLSSVLQPGGEVWAHMAATVLPIYVRNTVAMVLAVGVLVAVLGTGTAWLVTMCRFPGVRVFEWALILPMAMPAYVMAYTYTDFLQVSGPVQTWIRELTGWGARDYWFPQIRSLEGAVVMLAFVLYPYVYLLARAGFLEQSARALEVSRMLGCTAWGAFFRVALPLARPSIVAGTTLALMETLADYGTVAFFGVQTFTTGIVRAWMSFGDRIAASQLASLLLVCVLAVLLLERLSRGRRRYHHGTSGHARLPRYELTGGRALLAVLACLAPIAVGFLIPALILVRMVLDAGHAQLGAHYLTLAANSFTLAAVTAVLAVILATVMMYAARLQPRGLGQICARLVGLGYTIPGIVIAIGVLIPFAFLDNAIDSALRGLLGVSTGLLLTGGIAALVFAYLVRFMAVSLSAVESGLAKIGRSIDDAARNLGHGPAWTLLRVHTPMMRGSLLTAALMVFVDVIKELPATLVMRPFNFDTLAVQAFNLASDERLTLAAAPSLAIVAVGILPVIVLTRAIARSRRE